MSFDKSEELIKLVYNPELPDGTSNAIADLGIFIVGSVAALIALIIYLLVRKYSVRCKNNTCQSLAEMLMVEIRRSLMFSVLLRFTQLSYLYIVVKSVTAVLGGEHQNLFGSKGQVANSITYYLLFGLAVIWPIAITLFLMIMGPRRLAKEAVIEKFRSLYLSVRLESRLNLMITVNFLLRRIVVGVTIALLANRYGYQLIIMQLSCLCCITYDFTVMPFAVEALNFVEVMNETFLMTSVYMLHFFSDFVAEDTLRYNIGWYYIYLVALIFILNMLIIGGRMVLEMVAMWESYWFRAKMRRKILQALTSRRLKRQDKI